MAIAHWRQRDRYYRIIGSACEDCTAEYFPPVYMCPKCRSRRIVDREMPREGTLMTYTTLQEPLQGFEDQEPMIIGMVRLENGVRLVGQIVDTPPEQVKTGLRVRATFRKIRQDGHSGQIHYGYKFILAQ